MSKTEKINELLELFDRATAEDQIRIIVWARMIADASPEEIALIEAALQIEDHQEQMETIDGLVKAHFLAMQN